MRALPYGEQVATLYLRTAQVWITKVKVCTYVSSWTTCLRWLEALSKIGGRPQKGKVLGPYNQAVYGIHSQEDPVQSTILKPHKMDTRNGVTRQWLSDFVGAGNHP